jgi:two-component system sensor histidine kinase BarA
LQRITGDFEQFISIRKERRKADEAFIQDVMKRFDEPNWRFMKLKQRHRILPVS